MTRVLAILGLAVAIAVIGLTSSNPVFSWIAIAIVVVALVLLQGKLSLKTFLGILVNNENRASVSRFQVLCWTILVLSAFAAAALWNVQHGIENPLDIEIPAEIWAVMGISVASFVGSPLLKERKNPTKLYVNTGSPKTAAISDLFADETRDGFDQGRLDVGKLQMFLFTIILLVAYGAAIHELLSKVAAGEPIVQLPSISDGMIALLGISHSGYLANKAAQK